MKYTNYSPVHIVQMLVFAFVFVFDFVVVPWLRVFCVFFNYSVYIARLNLKHSHSFNSRSPNYIETKICSLSDSSYDMEISLVKSGDEKNIWIFKMKWNLTLFAW